MVHTTVQTISYIISLQVAMCLMSYLILLVQIYSFLNQQLGSFRVTSLTGSYQWCHSPLDTVNIDGMVQSTLNCKLNTHFTLLKLIKRGGGLIVEVGIMSR